ncbi:nibrin [Trichonephila clavipes]|nr:nibrin [Trichonephila clavipes]
MILLLGRIVGRLECGRTQLEVSEELGIAQSHIYRDVILEQHLRLFFGGAMGAEFLLMVDNARPHRAKHCRRMPSIGGYQPYGLDSILSGLESNRACVG